MSEKHLYGSMGSILLDHAESQCSEKRDRVFALLSLGVGGEKLKVDYAMSLGDLFLEAIRLWTANTSAHTVLLAKHLADALVPLPADIEAQEDRPKSFQLDLVESRRQGQHDQCITGSVCSAREHQIDYRASTAAGSLYRGTNPKEQLRTKVGELKPEFGVEWPRVDCQSTTLRLTDIKFSQLHCSDLVVQVEDTSLFLVVRTAGTNTDFEIVARLAVFADEVNGTAQILSYWLPWSKTLAQMCRVIQNNDGQQLIPFNAASLRRFLTLVSHEEVKLETQSEERSSSVTLQCLRWQDEPQGTSSITGVLELQDYYRRERLRHKIRFGKILAQQELSTGQACQAIRTQKLNIDAPEDFKRTPSWRELLGRE